MGQDHFCRFQDKSKCTPSKSKKDPSLGLSSLVSPTGNTQTQLALRLLTKQLGAVAAPTAQHWNEPTDYNPEFLPFSSSALSLQLFSAKGPLPWQTQTSGPWLDLVGAPNEKTPNSGQQSYGFPGHALVGPLVLVRRYLLVRACIPRCPPSIGP